MIIKQIQFFFKHFHQFVIKYKAGFFHIPFFANSPENIVANFESMPFIDWDKKNKVLTSNNPLVGGYAYFHKIEDGLWFHLSEVTYKANVIYDYFYDVKVPANYHVISFNLVENPASSKMILMNGISFKSCTWNFCKPKANQKLVYFKGSTNKSLALYASEDWIIHNLKNYDNFKNSDFNLFMDSLTEITIWQNFGNLDNDFFQKGFKILKDTTNNKEQDLKTLNNSIINYLIDQYKFDAVANLETVDKPDVIIKLNKIEKKLQDAVFGDFPSIESLSKEFNISPTGLKQKFKDNFGASVYQYYLDKQLEIAMMLLTEKGKKVGEVSKIFKYASDGKFTIAFKKKFGVLPSSFK